MLSLFDQIARMGSPGDKVSALLEYPGQEELKTVLRLATDPFIKFGITDFTMGVLDAPSVTLYPLLERIAHRELTGNQARAVLGSALAYYPDDYQELVSRILKKDLRCGVGEKLVLKAYPGLIREFEVMRAVPLAKVKFSPRSTYYCEPKLDGLRGLATVNGQSASILSRNGHAFTSCSHLFEPLIRMAEKAGKPLFFDGELVSGNFNQSSSAVRRKDQQNESTIYHIFDVLDEDEWRNPTRSYYHRRAMLEGLMIDHPNIRLVSSVRLEHPDQAYSYYNRYRDMGYEGAIIKNSAGLYRFKRHKDWVKMKAVNDVDLVVESLVQGEGKYHGMLGAAIVKYRNKRVNVGSGWSDYERQFYWDNPDKLKGKVIEIQYHEETPDGSLRHPRFVKIREDKSQ